MTSQPLRSRNWFGRQDLDGFLHRAWLALVRTGDEIELDVSRRTLTLRVDDAELARRRAAWRPRSPHFTRGYGRLFLDHVLQASEGCDFDFLRGCTPVRDEDSAGPSHG